MSDENKAFLSLMKEKYSKMNRQKMSIKKALQMMDDFIDPSDPDLDVENSIHAYQTAERIRRKYEKDVIKEIRKSKKKRKEYS